MRTLTDEAEFEVLKGEHDVLVAYFTRDTCSVGESVFPRVAGLLEGSEVPLVTVDVTALPSVAGQHMVFVVPALLVFVFGRELARHARVFSLAQVEDTLARARAIVDAA